jgi:hypothetical protein
MFELVFFKLVISQHLLDLSRVSLVDFAHVFLELGVLFVFLHLKICVALLIRLHFCHLVVVALLKFEHVFLHHLGDSLLVLALALLL